MATTINAGTATGGAAISADTTGILQLQSGSTPTTAITVDTSQNVGIGTSSPSYKLDVVNNSNADLISHIYNANAGSSARSALVFGNDISGSTSGLYQNSSTATALGGAGSLNLFIGTASPLTFSTAASERMRIDSSGNLLVGLSGIVNSISTNTINNLNATYPSLYVRNTTASNVAVLRVERGNSDGDAITFFQTTSQRGYITVATTGTTYNSISDYRLKENVKPQTNALDRVLALKPVAYDWIESKQSDEGFIAHELQEVIPTAVQGIKDEIDENGNPKFQGIDQSRIVSVLTAAIQELNAKVDAQAAEIKALKGAA